MSIPAPYDRFEGEVLPEWIDYNGHMNLAYYTVLFDYATDLLFDELGLGLDYRRTTQQGTFVAETHNLYERELLVGARIRVATQIVAADSKRLHLAHEMFALDGGYRTATQELMFLHPPRTRPSPAPTGSAAGSRCHPKIEAGLRLDRGRYLSAMIQMPFQFSGGGLSL